MVKRIAILKILSSFQMAAALMVIMAVSLLLSSCSGYPSALASSEPYSDLFQIDPALREYYQDLGGKDVLGPVITQPYNENEVICQYSANALLCFNPASTGAKRFFLAPLSLSFPLPAGKANPQATPYPPFQIVIDNLVGAENAGEVLTGVLYDPRMGRIEQYFENVGFYQDISKPNGAIHLLPYGAYVMSLKHPMNYPEVMRPDAQKVDMPFAIALERLGGFSFLGQPISEPFIASDGNLEQVFENAAIFAAPDQPNAVHLRNLPVQLQMIAYPPAEKKYDLSQNVVFYPTEGQLGYHVPVLFDTYIAQHGGVEISGKPIADTFRYDDQIDRQCYQNYCLEYISQADPDQRVRLTPLGYRYLELASIPGLSNRQSVPLQTANTVAPTQTNQVADAGPQNQESIPPTGETYSEASETPVGVFTLRVSRQFAELPPEGTQVIHLTVHQSVDLQPVSGIQAKINLQTPSGEIYYYAPPTNNSGRASFAVPPIEGVENGSVIGFDVCIEVDGDNSICEHGSYLVIQ